MVKGSAPRVTRHELRIEIVTRIERTDHWRAGVGRLNFVDDDHHHPADANSHLTTGVNSLAAVLVAAE